MFIKIFKILFLTVSKIINETVCISFFILSLRSYVCFTLTAHLNSDSNFVIRNTCYVFRFYKIKDIDYILKKFPNNGIKYQFLN